MCAAPALSSSFSVAQCGEATATGAGLILGYDSLPRGGLFVETVVAAAPGTAGRRARTAAFSVDHSFSVDALSEPISMTESENRNRAGMAAGTIVPRATIWPLRQNVFSH
jgi:hypothetical protein